MYKDMDTYKCSIVRGGTSKGIFIMRDELPADEQEKDVVLRKIFGSPDIRQIDGLGGADVLTSKLAILAPPTHADADIDYTFAQVSFETDFIDYKGNCGNISAAVGPYAIDEGLVPAVEPITQVRIHLTNSGHILTADVPVKDRKAVVAGDCKIDGVPGTGARIDMDWSDTVGSACGALLPTGNPKDMITVDEVEYEVSLVDMGNPLVFIKAESLGMKGTETSQEIDGNKDLNILIQKIRSEAAVIFGLVDAPEKAMTESPYIPFFAIVSPSQDYTGLNNTVVKKENIDFVSRLLFMLKMHKTYPITGTVCTGAASKIEGSVLWDVIAEENRGNETVRIGHPGGVIAVDVKTEDAPVKKIKSVKVFRTARRIMDGLVYVKK